MPAIPAFPALAVIGNAIPFIGGEEEKIRVETAKILGDGQCSAEFEIAVHCNRVPVTNGHLINVTVDLADDTGVADLKRLWESFTPLEGHGLPTAPRHPIVVLEGTDRPQPAIDTETGGGMSISIGRIRRERAGVFSFSLLLDNLVRGASGAAILNAEYIAAEIIES